MMTGNASEDIDETPIPTEIRRWNWAAFLNGYFWAMRNNLPLKYAQIAWIPLYGAYYLGRRGNQLAWEYGNWVRVEDFKKHQEKELNFALRCSIIWVLFIVVATLISVFPILFEQ